MRNSNIALSFQTILHVFKGFFPSHTFFMTRHNDEECILIYIHAHFDFEWSRNFPSLCIYSQDSLEESTRLSMCGYRGYRVAEHARKHDIMIVCKA